MTRDRVVIARFAAMDRLAANVMESVLATAPTLGRGRLVCVDGPAGSGKTTLGAALRRAARDLLPDDGSVDLVHMDNLYAGWDGLATGMATVATSVVQPLRIGRPGRYRRFDWYAMAFAEERVVDPVDVLVLEGVGSASAAYDDAITCLVWVEAPSAVRLDRGLARDGERLREHLLLWREAEEAMFARERTRERADVIVDGVSAKRL
jgi:uridine kinase